VTHTSTVYNPVLPQLVEDLHQLHHTFEPKMKEAQTIALQNDAAMDAFAKWANYPKDTSRFQSLIDELLETSPGITEAEICQELIAYFEREKASLPYTRKDIKAMQLEQPDVFRMAPLNILLDDSIALCRTALQQAGGPDTKRAFKLAITPFLAQYGSLNDAINEAKTRAAVSYSPGSPDETAISRLVEACTQEITVLLTSDWERRILQGTMMPDSTERLLGNMHRVIAAKGIETRLIDTEQGINYLEPVLDVLSQARAVCAKHQPQRGAARA
tara:strand:+ start:98 stop:916 length:819 start_codon:yes stop_codon:yes gene_type:complete